MMFDSTKQHALDDFSQYTWPAIKCGLLVDVVFSVLMALMLDGGRSARYCLVALIGHWLLIVLIVARRPASPTRIDLFCIRWGLPLLMILTNILAPYVCSVVGESTLSGIERLIAN
jgi:hypothetical protein